MDGILRHLLLFTDCTVVEKLLRMIGWWCLWKLKKSGVLLRKSGGLVALKQRCRLHSTEHRKKSGTIQTAIHKTPPSACPRGSLIKAIEKLWQPRQRTLRKKNNFFAQATRLSNSIRVGGDSPTKLSMTITIIVREKKETGAISFRDTLHNANDGDLPIYHSSYETVTMFTGDPQ